MFWTTESIYVDIETGEIIDKKLIKNGTYIKIKSETKYKHYENYKQKRIINECKPTKQRKIFEE